MGLASAVVIDASIVLLVLVPAFMMVLGNNNSWLPGWLDRILPHLDSEGTQRRKPIFCWGALRRAYCSARQRAAGETVGRCATKTCLSRPTCRVRVPKPNRARRPISYERVS